MLTRRNAALANGTCPTLEPHRHWLRTVVRNRVGEADAVDDILQEVAIAVCSGSPPDNDRLAPWLYRVAVKQCLQFRRKAGRQHKLRQRLTQDISETDEADPLDGLLLGERREAVRDALRELTDIDRQLLMLKYTEDWTYQQLASHLGVAADTIEYRLLRARRRMRHLLTSSHLVEVFP